MKKLTLHVHMETPQGRIDERVEVDPMNTQPGMDFMAGYIEGIMSFIPAIDIPLTVMDYHSLSDYEQMRARELLVVMSTKFEIKHSPMNPHLETKVRLEIHRDTPRIVIYEASVKQS